MTKRTWRFQSLRGEAEDIMASAPSLRAAAKALGVNLSTVVRWRRAGKISAPGGQRRAAGPPPSPDGWGASVRAHYELNATESELLALAEMALRMAGDDALTPTARLAAMGRFAHLVRQIDLEVPDGEVATSAVPGPVTRWRHAARGSRPLR